MAEQATGSAKITIVVKPTASGEKLQIEVDPASTVLDLKNEIAKLPNQPKAEEQRVIYKGQILKDEKKIDDYGVKHEHTVHLVKGKPAGNQTSAAAPQASQAAASPPNPLQFQHGAAMNMMNDPAFQQFLNNPELMQSMLQSNPMLQRLIERNPELGQILNDPSTLRQTMQVATNPSLMREQLRNADRALSNIEGMPEGFNALRRIYETIQEPLMDAATTQNQAAGGNPLAALFGNAAANPNATGAASTTPADGGEEPNASPLPNPWAPSVPAATGAVGGLDPMAAFGGMPPGFGGMGAGGQPDMGAMMQMMENPMIQQMMSSMVSQPGFMESIINSNPQLRALTDANPGVRAMMSNPEAMNQMMQPNNLQAMMQMHQALSGMPGMHPAPGGAPAAGLNANTAASGNSMANMMALMQQLGGMGALGGGVNAGGEMLVPVSDPETTWATQLQQLQDMGFYDRAANIAALTATAGNVNAAVERLLSGP